MRACPWCKCPNPDWLPGDAKEGQHQASAYGWDSHGTKFWFSVCKAIKIGRDYPRGWLNAESEVAGVRWHREKDAKGNLLWSGPVLDEVPAPAP